MGNETLLAVGYAGFLVAAAWLLERLAALTFRRSGARPPPGFRYREELDVYECPTGEHLLALPDDRRPGLRRYRAPHDRCRDCFFAVRCTPDRRPREVVRPLQPWLVSGIGRFHRGLSLTLLVLAAVILSLAAVVYGETSRELSLLVGALAVVTLRGLGIFRSLRATADNPRRANPSPPASPFPMSSAAHLDGSSTTSPSV